MPTPTTFGGPELDPPLPAQLLHRARTGLTAAVNRLTPSYEEIDAMKTTDKRTHLRNRLVAAGVSVAVDVLILAVAWDKYRKA